MEFWIGVIVIAAIVVSIITAAKFRKVVIFEHEKGLKYIKGRYVETLGPGSYRFWSGSTEVTKIDVRIATATLLGQELLSADGVPLKISMIANYEISDPYAAVNKVMDYRSSVQTSLQVALREVVSAFKIEDLIANRENASEKLKAAAAPKLAEFGVRLVSADVRDVMVPGELKKMFALVMKAQKEGLAVLEKARGETAALRNLANAAKMIEDNPNLLQLRMIRAISESTGNTFFVGLPNAITPVKVGDQKPASPEPPLIEPPDEA